MDPGLLDPGNLSSGVPTAIIKVNYIDGEGSFDLTFALAQVRTDPVRPDFWVPWLLQLLVELGSGGISTKSGHHCTDSPSEALFRAFVEVRSRCM